MDGGNTLCLAISLAFGRLLSRKRLDVLARYSHVEPPVLLLIDVEGVPGPVSASRLSSPVVF